MERRGRAAMVVGLPASVLVIDPGGLAPFGPAKWMVVPTLVLGGAAAVVWGERVRVARRPLVAWGVFLALVAVAAAVGLDPLYAWIGTPERHFGALTWLVCTVAFVAGHALLEGERRALGAVAAATAGLAGVWALAETLGWEPVELVGAGDRAVGPVGSSAYLGAALALLTPIAIGIGLDTSWSLRARRLAGVAAAAGAYGIVASGARAAWAGVAVAVFVVTVVGRRRLSTAKVVMAVGAFVALASVTGVAGRIPDVVNDRQGGARGRVDEWRVAARVIADRPVLGTGPEGYRIAFGGAVDDAYERVHGRDPLPDRAHAAPLDVAATTGLPGMLAYLALLGMAGMLVLRSFRSAPPWVVGVSAGLVAYAAQSLFLFPIAELEPVAWLLVGVVAVTTLRDDETITLRAPRLVPTLAAVAALVTVTAGALDVAADRSAANGDDPTRAAELRPDALRYRLVAARGLPDAAAIAQLEHALDVSPRDPVVRSEHANRVLQQARDFSDTARAEQARRLLLDLTEDDPRNAEVLLRLGLAHMLTGHPRQAEQAWLRAEHLAPRSAAAPANLALAYAQQDRWPEARAAARRALAIEPNNPRARAVLEQDPDGT